MKLIPVEEMWRETRECSPVESCMKRLFDKFGTNGLVQVIWFLTTSQTGCVRECTGKKPQNSFGLNTGFHKRYPERCCWNEHEHRNVKPYLNSLVQWVSRCWCWSFWIEIQSLDPSWVVFQSKLFLVIWICLFSSNFSPNPWKMLCATGPLR